MPKKKQLIKDIKQYQRSQEGQLRIISKLTNELEDRDIQITSLVDQLDSRDHLIQHLEAANDGIPDLNTRLQVRDQEAIEAAQQIADLQKVVNDLAEDKVKAMGHLAHVVQHGNKTSCEFCQAARATVANWGP